MSETQPPSADRRGAPAAGDGDAKPAPATWANVIPEDQWRMFMAGVDALEADHISFVLHGALGLAAYTGRFRNTKDVDVIVRERDHERAIAAVRGTGFADYFDTEAYDRSWIFRACQPAGIFDIIWALPNHRVVIDDPWFDRARPLALRGRGMLAAPPEEIIRVKLYVMQRGRCDWPDLLNIIAAVGGEIDWRWLVQRMGTDAGLLHGLLAIFNWLAPERARGLPGWLRAQFALEDFRVDDPDATEARRVPLFDSRPWFALHQSPDRPLER